MRVSLTYTALFISVVCTVSTGCTPNSVRDGATCEPCSDGYKCADDNVEAGCLDIDECAGITCGAGGKCEESEGETTPGKYTCVCEAGYGGGGVNAICLDVNECLLSSPPCGENSECVNETGGYGCNCILGFSSDGLASGEINSVGDGGCLDINECAEDTDTCGENTECSNTPGMWKCACKAGFSAEGDTTDIGTRSCERICIPDCVGKSCGDDGCGVSCGSCSSHQTCRDGVCDTSVGPLKINILFAEPIEERWNDPWYIADWAVQWGVDNLPDYLSLMFEKLTKQYQESGLNVTFEVSFTSISDNATHLSYLASLDPDWKDKITFAVMNPELAEDYANYINEHYRDNNAIVIWWREGGQTNPSSNGAGCGTNFAGECTQSTSFIQMTAGAFSINNSIKLLMHEIGHTLGGEHEDGFIGRTRYRIHGLDDALTDAEIPVRWFRTAMNTGYPLSCDCFYGNDRCSFESSMTACTPACSKGGCDESTENLTYFLVLASDRTLPAGTSVDVSIFNQGVYTVTLLDDTRIGGPYDASEDSITIAAMMESTTSTSYLNKYLAGIIDDNPKVQHDVIARMQAQIDRMSNPSSDFFDINTP